jgi:2,4-dienoyl-CoA reductase (NADPH2)
MPSATASRYPNLLAPIGLGPIRLKNRAVMSGHHLGLGDGSGGVGERLHRYIVAARGGAAMVGIESCPVHPSSIKGARPHLFDDAVVPGLAALADAVHDAGSKLSVILWHAGHNMTHLGAGQAWAPSAVPSSMFNETPKAMTRADIRELIAAYAAAARRCRQAELDVLEVQTSSDYLLGSFLNPTFNRRTDDYGGSAANRLRIVVEILEAVREAAGPNIAVAVRTSVAHLVPSDPRGYGETESLATIARLAELELIDYVSLISGSHFALHELMPPMDKPRAELRAAAGRFKRALAIPVMMAGRVRTPAEAEAAIGAGDTDVVASARNWLADPDWMAKTMAGHEGRIRPCISCNQACTFAQRGIGPATCSINPEAGRERDLPPPAPTGSPRRIAIVGGGPAGLEAARVAAARGHRVTLYEASDRLGGEMRLAAEAPERGEIITVLDWWQRELERLGVSVMLNRRFSPDRPPEADRVVWAIGATPGPTAIWRRRPNLIDGIPGAGTIHGRDVMAGHRKVAGNVLVIDEEGGWPAVSLVEHLAQLKDIAAITVTTPLHHLGVPDLVFSVEMPAASRRLQATGARILANTMVAKVENGVATLADGSTIGPFTAIVLSTGTAAPALPEGVLVVGDCLAPRGWWAAVDDAARIGRTL